MRAEFPPRWRAACRFHPHPRVRRSRPRRSRAHCRKSARRREVPTRNTGGRVRARVRRLQPVAFGQRPARRALVRQALRDDGSALGHDALLEFAPFRRMGRAETVADVRDRRACFECAFVRRRIDAERQAADDRRRRATRQRACELDRLIEWFAGADDRRTFATERRRGQRSRPDSPDRLT
jgi:hypothetical protein